MVDGDSRPAERDRDGSARIFRPARSFGWLWLLSLIALCSLPTLAVLQPEVVQSEEAGAVWVTLAIMAPLVTFLLATLLSLPFMRYELADDALIASCGPLLRYRVPYAEITDVRRVNLIPSLWSSMRLPGLALWTVPYAEEGPIRMCATRMARDILLVSAGGKRYGITPAEEATFAAVLVARLPADREV